MAKVTEKLVKESLRDDERFVPADELPPGLSERVRALVNAAEVREGYTVPWAAGRSPDGKRLYPDVDMPLEVAGLKTRRTTGFHEIAELLEMDAGNTYDKDSVPPGTAHYIANGIEKLEVEAQGGNWDDYCIGFRPLIKETDDPALINLPPKDDWDRRPYEDDDPTLAAAIDAADKSTFSAPASATSGLQGFDLEGAAARRRKRRKRQAAGELQPVTKESSPMDLLNLFIPITKIDAQKRLVYGVATAEKPDVAKEICDYVTTKPLYQKWSENFSTVTEGKSFGNLRAMHGNVAAGKLTDIAFNDEEKKIEIAAKVVDDAEWAKVEEGVYTGFSQGGKYVKRWKDGDYTRYTAEPIEVSLVDNPCLPEATFSVIKADGTTEFRKFKALVEKVDAPNDNEVGKQVWINDRLPGKTFDKKADLREALIDLDFAEVAKKTAAPVLDVLDTIKENLAKANGEAPVADPAQPPGDGGVVKKKDYSDEERKQGAKDGWAKKDGSYPIKTATDVANAVKDWFGSKGSASDKRHIIKRAKALGATDSLPADWSGSTKKSESKKNVGADSEFGKGVWLYDLSNMLSLLAQVEQLEDVVDCKEWGPFVSLPVELQGRLTAMIGEFGDIIAEMLDLVLAEIGPDEEGDTVEAASRVIDLQKLGGAWALAKAGAKHAKADKERIKKAHDLLTELDPDCCPGGQDDDAEKLAKQLNAAQSANARLLNETILPEIKKIADELAKVRTDVKTVAEQPLPMGTSSVTLRVVDKAADGTTAKTSSTETLEQLADRALAEARRGSASAA